MKISSIPFLFCLSLLFSCQAPPTTSAPPKDVRFRTTPPSKLYFNNIRSTSYLLVEEPNTQTHQYRLRGWPDTAATPFLLPVIIDNWLYDQAYLNLSWVGLEETPTPPYQILIKREKEEIYYSLDNLKWSTQHDFAQNLYHAIMAGYEFHLVKSDSQLIPIFTEEETRKLFRITLQDYRKLTEKQ